MPLPNGSYVFSARDGQGREHGRVSGQPIVHGQL